MTEETADSRKEPKKRDPDMAGAEQAMKRAAANARQKAMQVGAGIAVWKDGAVIEQHQKAVSGKQVAT